MVILEAYTFGLPVIAFDIETGPKELISEHTGSLIEPYNIKLFHKKSINIWIFLIMSLC